VAKGDSSREDISLVACLPEGFFRPAIGGIVTEVIKVVATRPVNGRAGSTLCKDRGAGRLVVYIGSSLYIFVESDFTACGISCRG
jgi:hypothetical protein